MAPQLTVDPQRIAEFCLKWRVKELSIFGSALREDFRPDSDVDVLVVFEDDAPWDLWDHMHAADELKAILGREVDLVEKSSLTNPFRRHHILSNREVIYAS